MDQFLERHNLPNVTRGAAEYLDRPLSLTEMESMINILLEQRAPDPDGVAGVSHQAFKGEIVPVVYSPLKETKQGNIL